MNLKEIENREQGSKWRNSDNSMLFRIQEYLKNGNYKSIRRIYKSFCEKNIYFLKSRHLGLLQSQFLHQIIQLSFKIYSTLNLHSNFQLHELLPLLLYIFKKYQLTLGVHLNFSKLTSVPPPLTATNNGRQLLGLSYSLLSKQINNIDLLMKKKSDLFEQIQSSNSEIEILIKPVLIASNQAFLRLKRRKKIDQEFLRKLFNGISNEGGGIVIFGKKKSISAENTKSDQLDYKFKKSIEFILSSFSYIKNWQITQFKPPKQSLFGNQQSDRDFYQVIIHPLEQNRLNFINFPSQKNLQKSFQFYKLDCLGQPFEVSEHCENIYSALHTLYGNSFRNKVPQIISNDGMKITKECKQKNFKFSQCTKNKALMLVKQNGEKYSKNYLRLLKNNKYEVEVNKLNCQSIQLPQNQVLKILTHQCSYAQLKLMLKICEQQGSVEQNTLKLMLPSKILQINSNKFGQKESKQLKLKIRKQMQMQEQRMDIVEIERVRHKGKEILLLKFDGMDESVVGLMCLLEMGISPTFVKQVLSSCHEHV